MGRRSFVRRTTGSLLAATIFGCDDCEEEPLPTGPERGEGRAHVLVLGAGMAGLSAARELRRKGISVEVIEGRDRLGGRVFTDDSLGAPVDLGASWIHGTSGNPLVELASEHDVTTIETDYDDLVLFDADGRRIGEDDFDELQGAWDQLLTEVALRAELRDDDVSVRRAIEDAVGDEELDPIEQRFLDWRIATLEVTSGEDLSGLSLLADDGDGFGGEDRLFPGGYHALIEAMADGTTVHLNRTASRVAIEDEGVTIEAGGETYRGDAAVITVPIGVLASGAITFEPALPADKRAASRRLSMGTLNKIALRFPEVFWPDDVQFICQMSPTHGEYPVMASYAYYADQPILLAFSGGSFARALEARSDEEIVAETMVCLRRMFGESVVAPDGHVITRWTSDPLARGSYPHIPVGATAADYDAIAEPFRDRLFFAGDGTIRSHPGTVHGALLSGRREAERVADLLAASAG